ncbi:hypothetical protein E5Q_03104 [Mixia osmundae IAM 14324]|uniref:Uncharacterized protein n=1 Tax=Mixia osmundae (strain CBS 9802 / IAM 14324 / JCM 22182 / KY 12970) TaxID=764103 RepID=G7E0S6_MIXOS|nr:hypothetical protein E5Q_03104 [Mixia osmundae IAM 14324]
MFSRTLIALVLIATTVFAHDNPKRFTKRTCKASPKNPAAKAPSTTNPPSTAPPSATTKPPAATKTPPTAQTPGPPQQQQQSHHHQSGGSGSPSGRPTICGQPYVFTPAADQWYKGPNDVVSAQLGGCNGNLATWSAHWNIQSPDKSLVRAYPSMKLDITAGPALSHIQSIPAQWSWHWTAPVTTHGFVSWHLWLGTAASKHEASPTSSRYQIKVHLATRGNAQPIGQYLGEDSVMGHHWKVFKGPEHTWTTISLVSSQDLSHKNSWQGDLAQVINWAVTKHNVPSSLFLTQVDAGPEALAGAAHWQATGWSAKLVTKDHASQ